MLPQYRSMMMFLLSQTRKELILRFACLVLHTLQFMYIYYANDSIILRATNKNFDRTRLKSNAHIYSFTLLYSICNNIIIFNMGMCDVTFACIINLHFSQNGIDNVALSWVLYISSFRVLIFLYYNDRN